MSRSNYSEDIEEWALIRWRGAVNSAIKGKRGQALLAEMVQALDAMPVKCLIANKLISEKGEVCALGAVAQHKSLKVDNVDPENSEEVAAIFDIANALACEIAYMNDEHYGDNPEARWKRMRGWAESCLVKSDRPHTPKP